MLEYVVPCVQEALSDVSLPPAARLAMWHLSERLSLTEFRDVKAATHTHEMRIAPVTAGRMLTLLVERGYLVGSVHRRPRAFRLPWSRCRGKERDR